MRPNSDIFVHTVAPVIGATYAFGRKFEPDSPHQRPEDIGFAVPVDDPDTVERFLELARAIEVKRGHHDSRQPRVYAFEELFPGTFGRVGTALAAQPQLACTDFGNLDLADVVLLPPPAHMAPWRLPEWMPNHPDLRWLVRLGLGWKFAPVRQPSTAA